MALLIEHGIEITLENLAEEYYAFRDKYWDGNTNYMEVYWKDPLEDTEESTNVTAIVRDGYWLPFEEFMNMVNTCEIGIHFEIKNWGNKGKLYGEVKDSSSINRLIAHVKPKKYSIEQLVMDLKVLNSGEEVDKLIITKSAIKRLMDKWDTINDSECDNKAIWFGLGAFQDDRPAVFIQYGRNPKLCGTYDKKHDEEKFGLNYTNESNNPGRIPSS